MPTKPSGADVRAAVYMAYRRHGEGRFRWPSGPVGAALKIGEDLGWIWTPTPTTGAVTPNGVQAIRDFLRCRT